MTSNDTSPTDDIATGFPPIVAECSQVLILGSMPSVASLKAQQYYGHARNQFWPIMGRILHFDPSIAYQQRTQLALQAGIAIWDVIHSCHRPGSADSAIESDSIQTQFFGTFFMQYPNIQHVAFNGRKAEQVFQRWVLPELSSDADYLNFHLLPSTSPAHASLSLINKTHIWHQRLQPLIRSIK